VALQYLRRYVLDVALASVELLDAVRLHVQEDDGMARVGKDAGEGDADVAGADDRDLAHGALRV
jgi:hypothetical protein